VPLLPEGWSFSRAFLPDAAPYFALGLVSASWVRGEGLVCLLVCALLAAWVGLAEGSGRVVVPLVWLLVLMAQRHWFGRLLEHKVWQFLGAISYPLYLLNEPVQRGLALFLAPLGPVWFSLVWLPLSLIGAIALAWLAHVVVEKPALFGPLRTKLTKVFLLLFWRYYT
jgi:peptidoglycan/LPS O-acetylase OafA/YrhL